MNTAGLAEGEEPAQPKQSSAVHVLGPCPGKLKLHPELAGAPSRFLSLAAIEWITWLLKNPSYCDQHQTQPDPGTNFVVSAEATG